MLISLCSCANEQDSQPERNNSRMLLISVGNGMSIYVDTETGVQYIRDSNGGICVMVDENGDPFIYNRVAGGKE